MNSIAALVVSGLVLAACATQPAAAAPVVVTDEINAQVQPLPPPVYQPAPVIYNYEQRSWPQSTPTHQWEGYVPVGYHPPENNAFDAAPASASAYSGPHEGAYCSPGVGLSVGFGIGGCSVGVGAGGIYAGVGLGCFPIGVGFGTWCH